jgi:hypothetical protein
MKRIKRRFFAPKVTDFTDLPTLNSDSKQKWGSSWKGLKNVITQKNWKTLAKYLESTTRSMLSTYIVHRKTSQR